MELKGNPETSKRFRVQYILCLSCQAQKQQPLRLGDVPERLGQMRAQKHDPLCAQSSVEQTIGKQTAERNQRRILPRGSDIDSLQHDQGVIEMTEHTGIPHSDDVATICNSNLPVLVCMYP